MATVELVDGLIFTVSEFWERAHLHWNVVVKDFIEEGIHFVVQTGAFNHDGTWEVWE